MVFCQRILTCMSFEHSAAIPQPNEGNDTDSVISESGTIVDVDAGAWMQEKVTTFEQTEKGIPFPEYVLVDLEDAVEAEPAVAEAVADMYEQCRRYTATVAEFEVLIANGYGDERFAEVSASRGRTHDATITAVNVAIATLKQHHFDVAEWTESFGLGDATRRQAYGKFAMLLTLKRVAEQLKQQQQQVAGDTADQFAA